MVKLAEYFARPNAPSLHSPVGQLMQRIAEKNPDIGFEEARTRAHELLGRAAAKRRYSIPRIRTPEAQERERERLKAAFTAIPRAA